MNKGLENALRKRIQSRFGRDIFVCSTLSWDDTIRIAVDRNSGIQTKHTIHWMGDWAWFDRDVHSAITQR